MLPRITKGPEHSCGHRGGENTPAATPREVAGGASPTTTPLHLLSLLLCCPERHAKQNKTKLLLHGKANHHPVWAGEGWWAEGSYMLTGQISGYLVTSFVSASPLTSQEICSSLMFLRLLPLAQTTRRWPVQAVTQHGGATSPVATLLCSLPVLVGTWHCWVTPRLLQGLC